MKHYLFLMGILFCFFSCSKKQYSTEIVVSWLIKERGINKIEKEYYIYPNGDSILNQFKSYEKGTILNSDSHYYNIENFKENENGEIYGRLYYNSSLDTLRNVIDRTVEFSFLQKIGDSVDFKTFKLDNDKKYLNFIYKDFDNNRLCGFLIESLAVKKPNDTAKSFRYIEQITLVDNRKTTYNPVNPEPRSLLKSKP